MRFEDYRLSEEVKRNIKSMGFKRPTDIQFKCIPHIQNGEDVLGIAQTGTGKTAAFVIPVIDKIQHIKIKSKLNYTPTRAVVVTPTRELAQQITNVFNQIGRKTGVKAVCIYGGVDQNFQVEKLEEGMDIVVGTPGRLFDLNAQGYLNFNKSNILIVDEADQMLALGFANDIKDLVKKIPTRRQTLFFSATITKQIKKTAYQLINSNAIRIQISPSAVNKNISHVVAMIKMDDKRFFLKSLIDQHEAKKFMVFVRTKVRAERVSKAMERVGIDALTIHGDKDQESRELALMAFKTGACKVLIATDVSARGIDVPEVDYVVNYDLPNQAENYVHRVGRTGRGTNKGNAISFCSPEEQSLLSDIELYINEKIDHIIISKNEYKQVVSVPEKSNNEDWRSLIE